MVQVALDERFVAVATSRAVHVYSRASLNHLCDIPIATSVLLLAQGTINCITVVFRVAV